MCGSDDLSRDGAADYRSDLHSMSEASKYPQCRFKGVPFPASSRV